MKKTALIISILFFAFTLSGCEGSQELTNMAIIQAVGIDLNGNEFTVSLQYLDIDKGTGTNEGVNGNITAVVKGKGNSINAAIDSVKKTISESLFFGQNKLVVIGANLSLENKILNGFMSDTNLVRPDVYVLKSVTNAEDIIKNKQRGKRVPAENVCKQAEKEKCVFTVNDYLNSLKKNNIPLIKAEKDYTLFVKHKRS